MLDMLTMSLSLWIMHVLFGEHLNDAVFHNPASMIVIPAMITITFAFANTYSREVTPLNIGNTEGLARGICCALILAVMSCIDRRAMPSIVTLWAGVFLVYLLLLQRQLLGLVRQQLNRATSDAHLSHKTRSKLMPQLPSEARSIAALPAPDSSVLHNALGGQQWHTNRKAQTGIGSQQSDYSADMWLKRLMDVIGSFFLLVVSLPVVLSAIVMIKLGSKGPALIRQRRIGRGGAPFHMWKLRSMDADTSPYARSPISDADPRLTKVGRLLRRLSIDEIPQLLNVLKGEMSLVGPRPEMPFIVAQYGPYERERLRATPGITGLWQISPARAMPIHENVELDLFYIERRNTFLDVAIMLRTVTAVVRGIGTA